MSYSIRSILLGAVATLALGGLAGAAPAKRKPAKKIDPVMRATPKVRALIYTKRGDYRKALATYQAMLKRSPRSTYVLERIGPLYFVTGKFASAVSLYRRAVRQVPRHAKSWYLYAYALRRSGEPAGAVKALTHYQRLRPRDPNTHYGKARAYLQLGQLTRARSAYQAFIKMARGKERLVAWVARAKVELQNLERTADKRLNKSAQVVIARARKHERAGRPLEAVKALKGGLFRSPGNRFIHAALVDLYFRQSNYVAALELLRQVKKKFKRYDRLTYRMALCLRETGNLPMAIQLYRKHLAKDPDDPDAHFGIAEALRRKGRDSEAIVHYKRYVTLEKRPQEQRWVAEAKKRLKALEAKLTASAPKVRPMPTKPSGPAPAPGSIEAMIRAQLEAKKRFEARQGGDVTTSGGGSGRSSGISAAARRRRRAEAQRRSWRERQRRAREARAARLRAWREKQAELRRKREAARRARVEAYKRRMAEIRRKREEARRKRIEAYKARMEAVRRKREEARRRVAEAKARRLAAQNADNVLSGASSALNQPTEDLLRRRAEKKESGNDWSGALTIWRRLHELKPQDRGVARAVARVASRAGQHAVAVAAYRTLIKSAPKDMGLYRKLRNAQRSAGMRLTPLPIKLPPMVVAGQKALSGGNGAMALKIANGLLAKNPNNVYALVIQADALVSLRRLKASMAPVLKAKQLKPSWAGAYRVLGNYYLKMRDRTRALSYYRTALKNLVNDPSEQRYEPYLKALIERLSD